MSIEITEEQFNKYLQDKLGFNETQPDRFNYRLGLQLKDSSFSEKWVEFSFDSGIWSRNPYGGVHGGVSCAVLDTAMGTGAVALTNRPVTTTDISISYLKPMNGENFYVRVEYTNVGRSLVRCIGKIYDADTGVLCVTGQGSFMVLPGEWMPVQARC